MCINVFLWESALGNVTETLSGSVRVSRGPRRTAGRSGEDKLGPISDRSSTTPVPLVVAMEDLKVLDLHLCLEEIKKNKRFVDSTPKRLMSYNKVYHRLGT